MRPSRGDEKWNRTIQVQNPNLKKLAVHPKNSCIASILKLRVAGGKNGRWTHGYVWPSDLKAALGQGEPPKNGRKGYHGDYELVPSNHLDIMDMRTFDKMLSEQDLDVRYEEGELLKEYYLRQTFDVRDGSLSVSSHPPSLAPPTLSLSRAKTNIRGLGRRLTDAQELPRYCKCSKFWKPDTLLLQCPSPTCGKSLYPECVIGDVLLEKCRDICREERRNIGREKTDQRATGTARL